VNSTITAIAVGRPTFVIVLPFFRKEASCSVPAPRFLLFKTIAQHTNEENYTGTLRIIPGEKKMIIDKRSHCRCHENELFYYTAEIAPLPPAITTVDYDQKIRSSWFV
jgi:hypothetical protein